MALQHPSLIRLQPGDVSPVVTDLSPPSKRRRLATRVRFALGIALALVPGGVALTCSSQTGENLSTKYALATPDNVITHLQNRIETGQAELEYDSKRGYLPAVLKALHIPVSSQVLVFSKTSVHKDLISPQTPRALYFNDDAYVGYVPDAKMLEVATTDTHLGPVYYTLLQRPKEKPLFFRTVSDCLECHATRTSNGIPEHLMRSVYAEMDGTPVPNAKSYVTTDASPLNERWGGWYVTGKHGSQRHMGNVVAGRKDDNVTVDQEQGANIIDLHSLVDTSFYLTPHSDIVALMVLAHQTHLQNLITRAGYQTRAAHSLVKEACEPLVKALLFVGEAPLKSPVSGTSGFAQEFTVGIPRDRKNRSLRDLELKRRMFRYPCSYTIYSAAFDALPDLAKDYIFRRLREVLSGRDRSKEFSHLSAADRKAVWEILLETKPAFAARSTRG
jgi:hypothetical protein